MFDLIAQIPEPPRGAFAAQVTLPAVADAAAVVSPPRESEFARWLVLMLDEIDYGMLLVGADTQVYYLNHAARMELDSQHPLQRVGSMLRVSHAQDVAPLHHALDAARRGRRKLVALGEGENRVAVSVVPLPAAHGSPEGSRITLLVLGKRRLCEQLSVQGFAREMGLTPAEAGVLELLCTGVKPTEVARCHGVAVSTVRTQIGHIRAKTGASGIRALVQQVALLPPLVGALRSPAAACRKEVPHIDPAATAAC